MAGFEVVFIDKLLALKDAPTTHLICIFVKTNVSGGRKFPILRYYIFEIRLHPWLSAELTHVDAMTFFADPDQGHRLSYGRFDWHLRRTSFSSWIRVLSRRSCCGSVVSALPGGRLQ